MTLNGTWVNNNAGKIAEEGIAHWGSPETTGATGCPLPGANVKMMLEIEAEIPACASDHVMRIVTENSRTLNFTNQG